MSERPRRKRPPGSKSAAALRYEKGDDAPRVVASGHGHIAEKIIALAKEHGLKIHEDPDLVQILAELDLGSVIPPEIYQVVAEVLAYVYRANTVARRRPRQPCRWSLF
jgi:flagellar biosynthesis protein